MKNVKQQEEGQQMKAAATDSLMLQLNELKAHAYNMIRLKEQAEAELRKINEQIAQLEATIKRGLPKAPPAKEPEKESEPSAKS